MNLHHDWLPLDDEANQVRKKYYLPTPEQIREACAYVLRRREDGDPITASSAHEPGWYCHESDIPSKGEGNANFVETVRRADCN